MSRENNSHINFIIKRNVTTVNKCQTILTISINSKKKLANGVTYLHTYIFYHDGCVNFSVCIS